VHCGNILALLCPKIPPNDLLQLARNFPANWLADF